VSGCVSAAPLEAPYRGGNEDAGQAADGQGKTKKGSPSMNDLPTTPVDVPPGREVATLGAGCFWCVEAIFRDLKGVDKVVSGYAGGHVANPTYYAVCDGKTGHAEAIQITFDPKVIAFADILHIFFTTHDPTTLNQQGADRGTQYRSAIFYHSDAQKAVGEKVIKEVNGEKIYRNPIVTEVTPFTNFYKAEDYHQDYYKKNPNQGYCTIVIAPKVRKFRQKYAHLLKQ
jgi:peptide-methionine (S)-S-oxide reductase